MPPSTPSKARMPSYTSPPFRIPFTTEITWQVHSNNVDSNFIALRAAAELGIKRFCQASSVNAIGLTYSNQPIEFEYFPVDERVKPKPTDAYALSKQIAEIQADCLTRWYPGMKVASLRIHRVGTVKEAQEEYAASPDIAARNLWGWVSPAATARACLLSVTSDKLIGHEIFNVVAPETVMEADSVELARAYYPGTQVRGDLPGKTGLWDTQKARDVLGWDHPETE